MSDDEEAAAAAAGEDGEVFRIIQFLIEGVLTAALGIFGILGNIVSIKVGLWNEKGTMNYVHTLGCVIPRTAVSPIKSEFPERPQIWLRERLQMYQ